MIHIRHKNKNKNKNKYNLLKRRKRMNTQEVIESQIIFPWTHLQSSEEVNTANDSIDYFVYKKIRKQMSY